MARWSAVADDETGTRNRAGGRMQNLVAGDAGHDRLAQGLVVDFRAKGCPSMRLRRSAASLSLLLPLTSHPLPNDNTAGADAGGAAQTGQTELVPDAAVVNGVPRGMFVGRSLLTGRAVCLLFLSGGRVTRFIPAGGLDRFDWARHQTDHAGDAGTWEMRAGLLRITWGDGGVHEGPLTVNPNGIEFHGKRYARPVPATLPAIAGRWEATRGTAIAGGPGVNTTTQLEIEPGGRYRWIGVVGGTVAGTATAGERRATGTVTITGATITFRADDGTASSHTFLPVAGNPVTAFGLDANLFTRLP
jgi:hypothetical protein